MRTLRRNRQSLHYATYKSKTAIKDDNGNETGEYEVKYNAPVAVGWNVSVIDSEAEVAMFGIDAKNVIRIVADKVDIDEATIIWYDKSPHVPFAESAPDHNYVISGIVPSLNGLVFYAKKVNTFAEQPVT